MLLCFIIIWVRASWWLENRWLDWWGGNQVQLMIHKIHHSLLVIKHHQSSLLGWSGSLETQTFYRLLHGDSRQFVRTSSNQLSSQQLHRTAVPVIGIPASPVMYPRLQIGQPGELTTTTMRLEAYFPRFSKCRFWPDLFKGWGRFGSRRSGVSSDNCLWALVI